MSIGSSPRRTCSLLILGMIVLPSQKASASTTWLTEYEIRHFEQASSLYTAERARVRVKEDYLRPSYNIATWNAQFWSYLIVNNPKAPPLLIQGLADKDRSDSLRQVYSMLLIASKYFDSKKHDFAPVVRVLRDRGDTPFARLAAIDFLLGRCVAGADDPLVAETKDILLELARNHREYKEIICQHIIPGHGALISDKRVQKYIAHELETDSDENYVGSIILMIRRVSMPINIDVLERLCMPGKPEYVVMRSALLLGHIGGPKAFNALVSAFNKHPKDVHRPRVYLLWALGNTKDPRATSFLLDCLTKEKSSMWFGIFEGLSYAGDKGALPALESFVNNPQNSEDQRAEARRTIGFINSGGRQYIY